MRLLKLVPDNTNIGFVRLRYWAFGLTALLTLAAAVLVGVRGLNLGVDFVGGVLIEARFVTAPSVDAVRSEVDGLHVGEAGVTTFGAPNVLSIRLPLPQSQDEGATNQLVKSVQST